MEFAHLAHGADCPPQSFLRLEQFFPRETSILAPQHARCGAMRVPNLSASGHINAEDAESALSFRELSQNRAGLTKFSTGKVSTAHGRLPPMCRIVQLRPQRQPGNLIRQSATTLVPAMSYIWNPGLTGVFEIWLGKCKFSLTRKEAAQSMSSILFFRCSRPIASCSFSGSSTFECLS
jgi:hypothetical protein